MARNFTLADVFNAGADFASTVATIQDRQLKEKAETDLLYMQAQVDSAASAFMQDLAQRNDYSNWQKDLDSFISQQGNKLQKESANAYTAKRAQEMMLRYRGELEQKVQLEALAKHKESVATTDEMTLQLIRNSFSGQDRLNKTGQVYDKEYATGVIDENNYVAKKINEATTTANDMYYKKYTTEIDNAIENGESLESVIARFEKDDIQLEIKALDSASANPDVLGTDKAVYKDISGSLDKKGIKDKLKPALQQYGKLKLAEIQNGNAKKLADIYALCQTSTGNDRAINIKSGKNLLKTFVGTNKLSEDDTVRYSNLFDALEDDLNKTGGKMIGSSGTKAFKAAIGVDPKGFIEAWRRGSLSAEGGFSSLYAAKEAYKSTVADELKKAGKTTEEIEKFLANDNGYNTLVREGAEIIFNSPEYGVLKADLVAFQKSILKGDYPPEAHGYLVDWVFDRIAQSDMSNTSFADVYKDYEKMKSVVTSKKLDKMFVLKNTKDKSIGEMAASLTEKDIVYTDINGNVRWMPGTEEMFTGEDGIGVQFGKVISQATGKTDLRQDWKQTDNGTDITNIPVFKDSEGNSYTVEPVYKNNNKDKAVIGYKVVDQNGKEYKQIDKADLEKQDKEKKKKLKEEKKDVKKEQQELAEKREQENLDMASKMSTPPKSINISETAWKMMSNSERVAELKKANLIKTR